MNGIAAGAFRKGEAYISTFKCDDSLVVHIVVTKSYSLAKANFDYIEALGPAQL